MSFNGCREVENVKSSERLRQTLSVMKVHLSLRLMCIKIVMISSFAHKFLSLKCLIFFIISFIGIQGNFHSFFNCTYFTSLDTHSNVWFCLNGQTYKQIVGINMTTNCAYLLLKILCILQIYSPEQRKKKEICLSRMTKSPTPTEMSNGQSNDTNRHQKVYDKAIADRLSD